jgi:CheY-like chemotaxis protein
MGALTKAAILVVDDHPGELTRLGQELKKRYGQDYQVSRCPSGPEALDVLATLKRSEQPLALALALRRLAALVPPLRANLVRYFGVFAPNARFRPSVVPAPPSLPILSSTDDGPPSPQ